MEYIWANIVMVFVLARAFFGGTTANSVKETGLMAKKMDSVYGNLLIIVNMKGNGSKIDSMGTEYLSIQEVLIKAISRTF